MLIANIQIIVAKIGPIQKFILTPILELINLVFLSFYLIANFSRAKYPY